MSDTLRDTIYWINIGFTVFFAVEAFLKLLILTPAVSRVCQWMDGWMGRWVGGWMDGWLGGWVSGQTDGSMDEWMDELMDVWTDRRIDIQMNWMKIKDGYILQIICLNISELFQKFSSKF